ncbi:MAG: hypothetical protein KF800_07285 [Lysobacter sp.]|nr:hypothetical protein [Lysobacter sp.]
MILFINLLLGIVFLLALLFMALYVTWIFISRLRRGESKPKSFLRWLRDLFDLVSGLG